MLAKSALEGIERNSLQPYGSNSVMDKLCAEESVEDSAP